jgi:hypothetical protein
MTLRTPLALLTSSGYLPSARQNKRVYGPFASHGGQCPWHKPAYLGIVFSRSFHPEGENHALLSPFLRWCSFPPALAKAKRAQSARAQSALQQGYQSSERPGYYHGYPLSEWYRDALSSY